METKELIFIKRIEPRFTKSGNRVNRDLYKCFCGNEFVTNKQRVKSGNTKSCGCLHISQLKERNTIHGLSTTVFYIAWKNLIYRCYNENAKNYKNYGGRGIKVCDRWLHSFENFYEDVSGSYAEGLTLDRINNDEWYSPDNFRWASTETQSLNKRNNRMVLYKGVAYPITIICRKLKVTLSTIIYRERKGMTFEEAVNGSKYQQAINEIK